MTAELPGPVLDEPMGDMGDQASRLQMAQEQEAIRAALAGRVEGTDALEDRGPLIEPLEGQDVLEADEADASDDPVYGGGMPLTDPEEARPRQFDDAVLDADVTMTGLAEDGASMAVEEGSSVEDVTLSVEDDAAAGSGGLAVRSYEQDGDPDVLDEEIVPLDADTEAEDLDALIDVLPQTHDPDDPQDPDGYGVPPAPATTDDDDPFHDFDKHPETD